MIRNSLTDIDIFQGERSHYKRDQMQVGRFQKCVTSVRQSPSRIYPCFFVTCSETHPKSRHDMTKLRNSAYP